MANARPIKTTCWVKFLISKGCVEAIGSKHYKWKCPGCIRSIIFRGAPKEIPFAHIHTNLQTMNVTHEDFWKWIDENC